MLTTLPKNCVFRVQTLAKHRQQNPLMAPHTALFMCCHQGAVQSWSPHPESEIAICAKSHLTSQHVWNYRPHLNPHIHPVHHSPQKTV